MLSKCAKPTCSVSFRQLGSGRLFRFELRYTIETMPERSGLGLHRDVWSRFGVLLAVRNCELTNTLSFDSVRGLTVKPIRADRDCGPTGECLKLTPMAEQAL
jgi:hypothetical protein